MDRMLMPGQHVVTTDHGVMMPGQGHVLPPSNAGLHLSPVNSELVHKIIQQLKIHGIFDEMRKECLADIDTKPAFLNLKQRVESHVKGILAEQEWKSTLNKNHLRSKIRELVMKSGILNEGVDRILHQVFSAKAQPVFLPKVRDFVKDKGQDIIKEFMQPPSAELISSTVIPQSQPLPPPPTSSPEEMDDRFQPPIPQQPPPPESPVQTNSAFTEEDIEPSDCTDAEDTAEILMYEEQEFLVKDVATSDVTLVMQDDNIVKAINTPSPKQMSPRDEGAPKIPEEVVNPLRNLIESLLVSKRTMDSVEPEDSVEIEGEVRVEDFSPTIDASQIESFTDDENEPMSVSVTEEYSPKPVSPTNYGQMEPSSPESGIIEPYSPPDNYTPQSPGQLYTEETMVIPTSPLQSDMEQEDRQNSQMKFEEGTMLPYDPSKFSFERISDSPSVNEGSSSAPSPVEAADSRAHKEQLTTFKSPDSSNSGVAPCDIDVSIKAKLDQVSSNSDSESQTSSSANSTDSQSDDNAIEMVSHIQETVEEMVEEIEVVEEFTSESEVVSSSEASVIEEKKEKKIPKAYQEKKKKKKIKKKKPKKPKAHKRARSSSISSGEITSSDSDSTNSSRPSRPPHPPIHNPPMLVDLEERRMHQESFVDPPYWQKPGSSSDFVGERLHQNSYWRYRDDFNRQHRLRSWNHRRSGSPRMRRPFSPPPGRPYSPEMRRFESGRERGMRYPPPSSHPYRERPVYRSDYRPRTRFSPPPYRRSPPPPHRYSPGLRIDGPRGPFISSRSPPRRSYSPPPRIFHGEPRPFPPPRHRWPSPPRAGAIRRIPSRSPPPGMRREGPGPSRY